MFSVYFDAGTESQPVANETKGEQQIKKDKKGMGVLTEICQRESSHGQQYEIKHIEIQNKKASPKKPSTRRCRMMPLEMVQAK